MTTQHILTAVKGFFMGAANVVPGVSGGTIALITGIFNEIIEALNSLMVPDTWECLLKGRIGEFWHRIHGGFIVALGIGIVASIFSLAKLMTYVLEHFPIMTWAFFFGLIIASAVLMFRDIKGWKVKDALFALLGILLGIAVCTLSPTETPDDMWFIFVCGAIAICTMILPGISGSFILLILGKYNYIMDAISTLNWPVMAVFGAGCVIGIMAFTKFLHWLLARYGRATMLVLLGFILGSLIKVWPWSNPEAICASQGLEPGSAYVPHYGAAALWCILGVAIVLGIDYLGRKKEGLPENTEQ